MTTDYRAICAELVELSAPVDSIPKLAERLQKLNELAVRARALLASSPDQDDATLKSIRERLILNHIIILKNVFGEENTARILFFRVEPRLYSYLKSFLIFLEFNIKTLPEVKYSELNTDPRVDRKLTQTEQ